MADAHANAAYSLVATAPSPATSGTSLVVTAGEGARFPAVPFNATVWPVGTLPLFTAGGTTGGNFEIVRVTGRSTDTLTITRAQESTTARTIVVGDQIAATITAKAFTDIENGYQLLDSDLTAIAALTPSNDDVLQRKSGAWTNRTPGQLKTDLAIVSEWDTIVTTTAARTTTAQTLTDIADLLVTVLGNQRYEFEVVLRISTSAVTTGTRYGIGFTGTTTAMNFTAVGPTSSIAAQVDAHNTIGTASAATYLTTASSVGILVIKGLLVAGSPGGDLTVQHLKVTSGTATVQIGSSLKVKLVG